MANKKLQRRAYSVLLLYPDYMEDCGMRETFFDHVKARDSDEAVKLAQLSAAIKNVEAEEPEDFAPIAVFRGHIEMVSQGEA